jgi:hypothetical protein
VAEFTPGSSCLAAQGFESESLRDSPRSMLDLLLQQGGFLEIVRLTGINEPGPVPEFGLPVLHVLGQVERPHLLPDDLGVEEWFGFDRQLFSG